MGNWKMSSKKRHFSRRIFIISLFDTHIDAEKISLSLSPSNRKHHHGILVVFLSERRDYLHRRNSSRSERPSRTRQSHRLPAAEGRSARENNPRGAVPHGRVHALRARPRRSLPVHPWTRSRGGGRSRRGRRDELQSRRFSDSVLSSVLLKYRQRATVQVLRAPEDKPVPSGEVRKERNHIVSGGGGGGGTRYLLFACCVFFVVASFSLSVRRVDAL